MKDKEQTASQGLGFSGALTILFIGLKLAHVINWSWWWVLSPLWISLAIVLGIVVLVLLIVLIVAIFKTKPRRF